MLIEILRKIPYLCEKEVRQNGLSICEKRVTTKKLWFQDEAIEQVQLMLDSYQHWLHEDLVPRKETQAEQARAIFHAPFVIVSHGIEADPILNYGNQLALELWEMDWEMLTKTPSRMTAEPVHRDERALLLKRTTENGYVDDYQGIRISSSGKRFRIDRAIVWNLLDATGSYAGQAATFSSWECL